MLSHVDKRLAQNELNLLSVRAERKLDEGKLRSAFRLYLAAAKGGGIGAQINLGNFYDDGTGVTRNRELALYWYRRAYRRGDASAANNIGVVFRKEGKLTRALAWFERAVELGDIDSNLEIAKIYLQENDRAKAARYLRRVCEAKANRVFESYREEAQSLLASIR